MCLKMVKKRTKIHLYISSILIEIRNPAPDYFEKLRNQNNDSAIYFSADLMQTSSSSNESRNSAKRVVASYSSCSVKQRPIFKDKNSSSSVSPLSETENKVYDYFDDEIDDQPDLTLNENDLTPATEFPPSKFPTTRCDS